MLIKFLKISIPQYNMIITKTAEKAVLKRGEAGHRGHGGSDFN